MLTDAFWQYLEYFGVITGVLYLILEMKQKPMMWLVGGICSLVYILVFAYSRIYADMSFNIYYAMMSFYGLFQWRRSLSGNGIIRESGRDMIEYTRITRAQLRKITIATIVIYGAIFFILNKFTDSPIPQGDAFTTTLSIVATWMLTQRIIEHWYYWVVINGASIYLYYVRGLYPTMGLYALYAIAAIAGYYMWKKKGVEYVAYP